MTAAAKCMRLCTTFTAATDVHHQSNHHLLLLLMSINSQTLKPSSTAVTDVSDVHHQKNNHLLLLLMSITRQFSLKDLIISSKNGNDPNLFQYCTKYECTAYNFE